jgi:hypothetical protein
MTAVPAQRDPLSRGRYPAAEGVLALSEKERNSPVDRHGKEHQKSCKQQQADNQPTQDQHAVDEMGCSDLSHRCDRIEKSHAVEKAARQKGLEKQEDKSQRNPAASSCLVLLNTHVLTSPLNESYSIKLSFEVHMVTKKIEKVNIFFISCKNKTRF